MATKSKFQAIKGVRDLLPPETSLWSRVEQTAREVFATFGFGEIRLPIFEPTELFARSIGADTDVVGKEMYTFLDNPDVAELESIRSSVKEVLGGPLAEKESVVFLVMVQYFIAQIKQRIRLRQMALSPIAQSDFDSVEKSFNELVALSDSPSDGDPDRRKALRTNIATKLQILSLGDTLSLRPEATASVCRAYIEHGMQQLPQPVKLFYMGPMFRRERPQKGRYRQFYQIGAEVLGGSDAPAIDAEVIQMLTTFFDKINLAGTTLYINSIGHSADNCRRAYVERLRAALQLVKDKLGPDSQRRIDTNPLRVLDSKLESEQAIIETLPHISDHLCADCAANYAGVKSELELRGVIYKENWRLVRGLDYYMRTTFEIVAQGLGSQNAVCGGGRYDGLVELLGGPPTKGIGFAIGEDRLMLSLQEGAKAAGAASDTPVAGRTAPLVYIAWMGDRAYATAVRAAKDLRNAGFSAELPPIALKIGKALGQADKLGAKYALILGDDEVAEGSWTLKTLADGTQTKLPVPALIEHLRSSS
jgi:histidyl-tRNA synthetase